MNVELQLYGSYGIPSSATTLAYDSIQRLLLVATTDGRIKLVGTACIDRTLTSALATATLSLHVLPNTGCFLRLDVVGTLELWSIQQRKCLYTLDPPGIADNITACCPLTHTPFVLVGCGSGALRVVGLLNTAEELVGPSRPVEGLQWMGYEMQCEEMNVPEDFELQEIVCMYYGELDVEVLLRHESNMVTALSMADREVLGQAKCGGDGFKAHKSEVTAICWASHTLTQILTGHEDGSIVHWRLQQGHFAKCREYFILEDDQRDAIHNLSMVLEPSMSIVVCGGSMADAPQSVSLIHVDPIEIDGERCPGAVREISHVPWLGRLQGFALVRPRGSLRMSDAPTGVIALTEGGYMCIHDIASGKTDPFVGDFQANAVVTTQLVLIPRLAGSTQQFVFEQLQARAPAASSSAAWHWALHSGALHAQGLEAGSASAQEVLITGHDNGSVLLWDVSHVTPQRLSMLTCGCRAVVTCTRLQEATGLLVAGHSTGEVNVAFWSPGADTESPATVLAAEHSSHRAPGSAPRKQQNDNWLHVLQIVGSEVVPGKDSSVVDMAWFVYGRPMTVWLAVAWAGGQVGVVDFSKGPESPVWLWEQQVTVEAIGSVTFMRIASKQRVDEDSELVLLVATAEGSFRSLHARTGDMLAPQWTVPKAKEPLIACLALSLDGSPAQASDLDGHVSLIAGAGGWRPLTSHDPVQEETKLTPAEDSVDDLEQTDPTTTPSVEPSPPTLLTETVAEHSEEALGENPAEGEELAAVAETERASGEGDADDTDPDENWEDQLEAAAKIEVKKGSNKKGIKGFLASAKRLTAQVGSVAKDAREAAAESTSWISKRRSQKLDSGTLDTEGSTVSEATAVFRGAGEDAGTAPETRETSPGPASPKHNPMNSSLALLGGLPSTAEWLLMVSKSSVRLYPAPAAISGNRRTTEKIKLDFDIDSAAVLAVPSQKPMLVGWSAASGLQMISLPGLDGCASQDLQDVTGWKWRWQSDSLAQNHIKRLFAICTSTGLVSVVGPCRELLMLGLCRNRPDLHIPDAFFDPDLASAAFSAECHNAPYTSTFGDSARRKQQSPQKSAAAKEQPASARMSVLFKGMEQKFKHAVGRASVDGPDSQPGDSSPGQVSPSAARIHCCGASPELRRLFQTGGLHEDDGEQPSAGGVQRTTSAPAAQSPQKGSARPSMAATAPRPSVASSSTAGTSSGAASSPAPRKVGARSAAEIKEAYGFSGRDRAASAQQGVAGTSAVMAENISRLHERKERLSRLEDRTADMVNDAEGFAAMAKKLNQQQSRPWWKPF